MKNNKKLAGVSLFVLFSPLLYVFYAGAWVVWHGFPELKSSIWGACCAIGLVFWVFAICILWLAGVFFCVETLKGK